MPERAFPDNPKMPPDCMPSYHLAQNLAGQSWHCILDFETRFALPLARPPPFSVSAFSVCLEIGLNVPFGVFAASGWSRLEIGLELRLILYHVWLCNAFGATHSSFIIHQAMRHSRTTKWMDGWTDDRTN
eukprot:364464-Chlamydomonas_euryale.AAC.1